MVSVVLPDDALAAQLPQARIVVAAGSHQVGAVGAKGAVPDPALVAVQGGLEREGGRVAVGGGGQGVAGLDVVGRGEVDGPDARGVVGGAGGEVAHVWGQQDAGDVGVVGEELADGDDGGEVAAHDHFPDVDVALGVLVHWLGGDTMTLIGRINRGCQDSPRCSPRRPYSHRSQPSHSPRSHHPQESAGDCTCSRPDPRSSRSRRDHS